MTSADVVRHNEIVEELMRMTRFEVSREHLSRMLSKATQCPVGELSPSCYYGLQSSVLEPLRSYRVALIVVDFQNDFVSGTLAVKDGQARQDPLEAVPLINALLESDKMDLVVYSKDWHPPYHVSFFEQCFNKDRQLSDADQTRNLKPFDLVHFHKPSTSQVLYPTHCVQGTLGAEINTNIRIVPNAIFVEKGTDVFVDSYSAFYDNQKKGKTNLEDILHKNDISVVLACGLAYEICVAATLRDAAELGFMSAMIADCSKGLVEEKIEQTNYSLRQQKVAILDSKKAAMIFSHQYVPIEWVELLLQKFAQGRIISFNKSTV